MSNLTGQQKARIVFMELFKAIYCVARFQNLSDYARASCIGTTWEDDFNIARGARS